MTTALNKATQRIGARRADGDDHLTKPFAAGAPGRAIGPAPKEPRLLEAPTRHAGHILTCPAILERLRRMLDIPGPASPIMTARGEGYQPVVA